MTETVAVIVGANLAGARAAEALRKSGFQERIVLFGEERERPYERPPLSKDLLLHPDRLPDNFYLHSESFYAEHGIELRTGERVTRIEPAQQHVVTADGNHHAASKILLCTGGRARRLRVPGAECDGVHYLRSLADALAVRSRLTAGARIVVVGMGVIGAEVAASAVQLGCEVTAIEPLEYPMGRLFGRHYGSWLATKHRAEGVTLLLKTTVVKMHESAGRVVAVETDDGAVIAADAVLVGIGIDPAVELAVDAGIEVSNGIVVDSQCRTSLSGVWAAGDIASQPDFFEPTRRTRIETFQNAQDQGMAAAASMLGKPVEYLRPPWFWTDQYNLNVQQCGRIEERATRVLRGDENEENFSAFFLRDGVVEGVLTVNRPADMGVGKRLVERRAKPIAQELADTTIPLRNFLR